MLLSRAQLMPGLDGGFGASLEQCKASSGAHARCRFTLGLGSILTKAVVNCKYRQPVSYTATSEVRRARLGTRQRGPC